MQGLLAQWDFQVGYSTEKLLDNRRFFGLQPFCILGHTHAIDTQIFFADITAEKVEEVINADLANVDKWYEQNGMKMNASKYQAILMGKSQVKPRFYCENTAFPITGELEMLGVAVDDKTKFERHIGNVCRKVSQQIAVLKRMKKILPFETRKCLYLGFIIPHFNYCSETWH